MYENADSYTKVGLYYKEHNGYACQVGVNFMNEEQYEYADFIVTRAKDLGVVIEDNPLSNAVNFVMKRWYDNDKQLAEAFEYLQKSSVEHQKEIALELINKIQQS